MFLPKKSLPFSSRRRSASAPLCMSSHSGFMRKRTASDLNIVSIPTKRMRTAPWPRMLSPFGAAITGNAQASFKTVASSGDANSFKDDRSTLNGGSQVLNSTEVDCTLEFDERFLYDSGEISTKPKRRKTRSIWWQLDSTVPHEQHSAKKPKIMKQSLDVSFNMSNSNKFFKMIGGRDRGKKTKGLTAPHGQAGFGSVWTQFEDQALVVLVRDLGHYWELISTLSTVLCNSRASFAGQENA